MPLKLVEHLRVSFLDLDVNLLYNQLGFRPEVLPDPFARMYLLIMYPR